MTIVLRDGDRRHRLTGSHSRLGRSPQCEVSLPGGPDAVVSWEHATVQVRDGLVLVTDIGSTNGTFVNGRKLEPNRPLCVTVGDRIRFGTKGPELVIESIAAAVAPESLPPPPPPVVLLPPPPPPPPRLPQPPLPEVADYPPPRARYPEPSAPARRANQPTNTHLHRVVEQIRGERRTATVVAVVGVAVCLLAVGLVLAFSYLGKKRMDPAVAVAFEEERRKDEERREEEKRREEERRQKEETKRKEDEARRKQEEERTRPLTGPEIHARLIRSVVWIVNYPKNSPPGLYKGGTGVVIDAAKGLILTADHVVRGERLIKIAFPRRRPKGGELETNRERYFENNWFIEAKVVRRIPEADLALLQLTAPVPKGTEALPLSAADPLQGDACHTVANQGNSGLWVYNTGKINQIEYRENPLKVGQDVVQMGTWVFQSSRPVNPGDSGGPLVNDRAELIGVNSSVQVILNAANRHVARKVLVAFIAGQALPGPPR